jgi:tetratricopeptide (TPR) repeat protein/glycosyltransferase involved in cell wall biosynthesis
MTTTSTKSSVSARELFDAAVAHHLAGRADVAIAAYRDALDADPTFAPAMNNLGALLASRGDEHEAVTLFEHAVRADPTYAEAQNNLGIALTKRGRPHDAIPRFELALAQEPWRAPWWNNLGNACVECFRFDRALEAYDRAIAIDATSADVWSNRGLALRGLRRPGEAIDSFNRAIAVDSRFANALVNLGIVLKEQRRAEEAIVVFERARAIAPNDPQLLCNFASVYESRGDYDRMRELADLAAAIDPAFPESHVLRGNHHMERGELPEAESAYAHARSLDAENRNANWNLALIWLLQGDYRRGWAQFEWRRRLQSVLLEHNEYPGSAWSGEALGDRTILVYSEQGLGDAIQFVRYAEELKRRGAGRVILEAPAPIVSLLAGARGVDDVVVRGAPLPPCDVHASLMDLPRLCGTTLETVPATIPYLQAPPRPVSSLVDAASGVLKIGIVWAGNPMHQRDHLRSVSLSQLGAVFDQPGARFYSLQKGGPEGELARLASSRVVDLSPHLADFRDTAAAIAKLDLVITVDTSVAHLAAALGRETWIMITHVPDFRWMMDRDDSPWYPTVRLFRQPAPRDWASVIANVRRALEARVGAASSRAAPWIAVTPVAKPADEPLTTITSAARHDGGRPRFELSVALADLAQPRLFSEYENELLRRGDDRPVTGFLSEALRDGDVVLDPSPGLGLVALDMATAPSPAVMVHVIEPSEARAERLMRAALDADAADRIVVHRSPPGFDALGAAAIGGRRVVLRLGDAVLTAEHLAAFTGDGALDISAVVWSSARPDAISGALHVLTQHRYWLGTVSLADGEVVLDPLIDRQSAQAVIALDPSFFEELTARRDVAAATAGSTRSGAATPARWLAFDWEVRGDTGWGIYGLNLATQLALRGDPVPIVLACNGDSLPALARHRLRDTLAASAPASEALADGRSTLTIEGTLLCALGNGLAGAGHGARLRGDRTVGVAFFEDTHIVPAAIDRADAFDAIIAGSARNAQVLQAYGLERVHTVIQGIDPAIFHPAVRTGVFRDRFVVFSGGKLEYRKGQDIVVAAFRRFRERHKDAFLLTAWHNHWPQLIADLELARHVRGLPRVIGSTLRVDEWLAANGIPADATLDVGCTPNALMGQVLREADVALFPNRCEGGTNLVAMECMAAGVPTIVSANTGHLDLIATAGCFALRKQGDVPRPTRYFTGVDGWGESDVDEIVDLLERLYHDRELARNRAEIGAAAMARLTWESQIGELLAVIA